MVVVFVALAVVLTDAFDNVYTFTFIIGVTVASVDATMTLALTCPVCFYSSPLLTRLYIVYILVLNYFTFTCLLTVFMYHGFIFCHSFQLWALMQMHRS